MLFFFISRFALIFIQMLITELILLISLAPTIGFCMKEEEHLGWNSPLAWMSLKSTCIGFRGHLKHLFLLLSTSYGSANPVGSI